MKRVLSYVIALISCLSMHSQEAIDYLNVGKTIKFEKQRFQLAWSAHPADYYYIQEWLPNDETFENYNRMFTVTIHFSEELTPFIAVQNKAAELDERKKNDKVCNYNVFENGNDYVIDFIVGDASDGLLNLVEHDVHHYKQVVINGKKALQLNFISERSYGDDIIPFLQALKDRRESIIGSLTKMKVKCKIK